MRHKSKKTCANKGNIKKDKVHRFAFRYSYMKYQPILLALLLCSCASNNNKTEDTQRTDTFASVVPIDTPSLVDESNIQIDDADTIVRSGYILYFQPAEQKKFAPYYPDQAARDTLIKDMGNYHDRAIAIEHYYRDKYNDVFTSNDSLLIIKLFDGREVIFPQWDDHAQEGYNFDRYFSKIGYVLLHVQYYEGDAWTLVNRKNGHKTWLGGLPYFSPDMRSFLTASADLEAHYNFNGMEYYKLGIDTPILQFLLPITNWGPSSLQWIGSNKVLVEMEDWEAIPDSVIYNHRYGTMTIQEK